MKFVNLFKKRKDQPSNRASNSPSPSAPPPLYPTLSSLTAREAKKLEEWEDNEGRLDNQNKILLIRGWITLAKRPPNNLKSVLSIANFIINHSKKIGARRNDVSQLAKEYERVLALAIIFSMGKSTGLQNRSCIKLSYILESSLPDVVFEKEDKDSAGLISNYSISFEERKMKKEDIPSHPDISKIQIIF